ncbi:putative nuclease HARBI1 [Neoarius graeffei]|uniref:putative nuclease HARBI1 n=1 Tax=Neoarius graeffei TaxID=443677 RepID=UPI00298C70EA|nr:putative nuclease HARBI1 [Neoarius graeffei]
MERAVKRKRVFRDRTNPLEVYNDDEIISRFRLTREAILRLTDELGEVLGPTTERSHSIPALLQVCTALRFYATGSFLNTVGDTVGLSKASVSQVAYRASGALSERLPQFPTEPAELSRLKRGFYNISRFPNVVGAIDGTHVKVQAPSENEHLFINRKGYHSLNIQALCDHNLKFLNCVAHWPGSVHDSRILQNSQLCEAFEEGIIDGILLGDSGYPLKPWLLTPFLNPTTPAQRKYNAAHCSTRNTIERAFGVLKRRFHCLHGELRMIPDRVCNIVCATVVLHNMARDLQLPDPEEEEGVVHHNVEDREDEEDQQGAGRFIFNCIPGEGEDMESEWTMFLTSIAEAAVQSCNCKVVGARRP